MDLGKKQPRLFILNKRSILVESDSDKWLEFIGNEGNITIASRWIENIEVCTKFLGYSINESKKAPDLFRTEAIDDDLNEYVVFSKTLEEAETEHRLMIRKVKNLLKLSRYFSKGEIKKLFTPNLSPCHLKRNKVKIISFYQ